MFQKRKGTEGIIEIDNPNLLKAKALKAKNIEVSYVYVFSYRLIVTGISCRLVIQYFPFLYAAWKDY